MSIQSTIQAKLDDYAPSMRRVAEAILGRPEVVMELTISELARRCDTSETTIVRFCRTLELTGYVQLRLAMATEIGRERAQQTGTDHGGDLADDDSLAALVARIAFSERLGIEETLATLDLEVLAEAIEVIDKAGRIMLYGVGASSSTAADLQRKLLRIDRNAYTFSDAHEAAGMTGLLAKGDVAMAFSHSGTTTEAVEFLRAARRRKATTVGITNAAGSALASVADLCLLTAVRETAFRSGAMASRIAQLMLVDCLFVGVAQCRPSATRGALKRTFNAAAPLRERSSTTAEDR
ncbi:MurR/RpiR family transcriptional regulator [Propionibacteriaceae bacterium Y1685]